MAGISIEGAGKKKALDSEINMIPMIDLLMVTVSFLLITAVWSTMARVDANAQVPGDPNAATPPSAPETRVHVDIRDEHHYVVSLRQGETTLESREIEQYDLLARELADDWARRGVHRAPGDRERDVVVLHAGNDVRFEEMVKVMDAALGVKRPQTHDSAFRVTFAAR
jgi:biopolymer transport protein ExbD